MTEKEAQALTAEVMRHAMTEREAEAWAARLIRLIGIEEGASSYQLSNMNTFFSFQGSLHGNDFHVQISAAICCIMLSRGRDAAGNGYFYLNSVTNEIQHLYCDGVTDVTEAVLQFVEQWLPFFRRCCWLLGCDIEASAHERAEWIQGFGQEELAAWKLKM